MGDSERLVPFIRISNHMTGGRHSDQFIAESKT
jgi:hypothetical protein